jgi:DnaK suppressor protein
MTSIQLERLRLVLESQLKELGILRRHQNIAVEATPDPLDDVVFAGERDLALRSLDARFAQVRLVTAAMRRIGHGSYGYCVQCEEEIGIKRLTALPQAHFCVRCQEEAEQQGESSGLVEDSIDLGPIEKVSCRVTSIMTSRVRTVRRQEEQGGPFEDALASEGCR